MPLCLPISPLITWRQCTLEGAGGGGCSLQPCLPTILVFPAGRDLARSARPCSCPGPDSLHAEKESWQSQKNRSPSTFCDKNINQHLFKSQQIFSEHFPCARHRADYIGLRASVSKVHNQGLKEQGPRKAVCASELRIEMLAISLPQPYSTVGTSPPQSTRSSCLLSQPELPGSQQVPRLSPSKAQPGLPRLAFISRGPGMGKGHELPGFQSAISSRYFSLPSIGIFWGNSHFCKAAQLIAD